MGKVIGDIGSCHGGSLVLAKDAISTGAACGLDAVKFQLFKESKGNIPLPYEWFGELVEHGRSVNIEVFASVWDREGFELVLEYCQSIKFAYSQRNCTLVKAALKLKMKTVYVSCGVMDTAERGATSLYCIPEYPVSYRVSFEGIFPRFAGFSDHTLGISQSVEATRAGARIIEKHFQLGKVDCPDAKFALMPNELEKLCKGVKCESL